jgi:hypothetical protein
MHTIFTGIVHTLEVMFVFLATFAVAAGIMGFFGGVGVTELRFALLEAVVACVLWVRYGQRPA